MPAGSTFKIRGVKQNSEVETLSGFTSKSDAEQVGDALVASQYFVSYTVVEYPAGGGPPIEYDQN